jgi:hypothetical protein
MEMVPATGIEPPVGECRQTYLLPRVGIESISEVKYENGAGNRNRTRDPLITNQVLYQLSYTGTGIAAPPLASKHAKGPALCLGDIMGHLVGSP